MSDIKLARTSTDKPRDIVTKTIGKMIVSGEIVPGNRLPTEAELGEHIR